MEVLTSREAVLEDYTRSIELFEHQILNIDYLNSGVNNPYGNVGELHNECVKYLRQKHDKLNVKQMVKTAFDFLCASDKGFVKKYDESFEESIYLICDKLLSEIEKADSVNMDLINLLEMDKPLKSEFSWLFDSILSFNPAHHSFIDKIDRLNTWEDRLIKGKCNSTITAPLLISSSVARHSTKLWNDDLVEKSNSKKDKKKKCLRAVFIVSADVIGAAGGAVGGAVVGGIGGAIVGGVVASSVLSAGAGAIFR